MSYRPGNKSWAQIFESLQTLFLCLFVASLCLGRVVNQSFLIAALFFSLFIIRRKKIKENYPAVITLILVYLVAVISTTYSENKSEALFVLEKQFTLFILPVILGFSMNVTPAKIRLILWSFNTSVFAVCLYLLFLFY